jgi:hypothetical protein
MIIFYDRRKPGGEDQAAEKEKLFQAKRPIIKRIRK